MSRNDYDVKVLNGLIATTIDSVDGYRAAAADAETERFRSIFTDRANEREDLVLEFQTQVRALGGEPEDDGSFLAGAQRMFMNLRAAVSSHNDEAVVAEVERGEDYIKSKFEEAMADDRLDPATRQVIERCFVSVKEGRDEMSAFKHAHLPKPGSI